MRLFIALIAALLAACAQESPTAPPAGAPTERIAPVATDVPAGRYTLEKSHASLIFRVDHLGFSMYTARFRHFDATLELDPADPESASLTALIDAASIETDFPYPDMIDFNAKLRGEDWLDAAAHPEMTFAGRRVELTGPDTARITGDFTFRGVTRPVEFLARYNGGYRGFAPYDPQARIGFSAKGTLKRSEFGMTIGIPTPEAPIGVGDEVEFIIEAEFIGPPLPAEES